MMRQKRTDSVRFFIFAIIAIQIKNYGTTKKETS